MLALRKRINKCDVVGVVCVNVKLKNENDETHVFNVIHLLNLMMTHSM